MSVLFDEYAPLVDMLRSGKDKEFIDLIRSIEPRRMQEIKDLIPTLNRQEYGNKIDVFQKQLQYYEKQKRVKANMLDDNGISILHRAVEFKRPQIVKFLLKAGADPTYISNNQSILSFLFMYSINDVDVDGYQKRFEDTLMQLVDLKLFFINKNPKAIEDIYVQLEITEDIEADFKIRPYLQYFPKLLNLQESKRLEKLSSTKGDMSFMQHVLCHFRYRCTKMIENRLIDRAGFPFKIRSWNHVVRVLKRKALQDLAKDIRKDLEIVRKAEWYDPNILCEIIRSYYFEHLGIIDQQYVDHCRKAYENEMSVILKDTQLLTNYQYQLLIFRRKKIQYLILFGYQGDILKQTLRYKALQDAYGGFGDSQEFIKQKQMRMNTQKINLVDFLMTRMTKEQFKKQLDRNATRIIVRIFDIERIKQMPLDINLALVVLTLEIINRDMEMREDVLLYLMSKEHQAMGYANGRRLSYTNYLLWLKDTMSLYERDDSAEIAERILQMYRRQKLQKLKF